MTQEELDLIIAMHKIWLESSEKMGEQANFSKKNINSKYPKPTKGYFRVIFYNNGYLSALSETLHICNPTKFELENEEISYFTGLNFHGANLTKAIFDDAVFYDCNMSNVNLSSCDLSNAKFGKVTFENSYFGGDMMSNSGITSTHSKLSGAYFISCNFSKCHLQKINFTNSTLTSSTFEESNLWLADFSGATLNMATFKGAELMQAIFKSCNLENANFENSNLTSADMSYANLHLSNFSNAKTDGLTCRMERFTKRLFNKSSPVNSNLKFLGCRIEYSHGNERFKKAIKEESYIEEFSLENPIIYKLWLVSSDCGRSIKLWLSWSFIIVNIFAFIYLNLGVNNFNFSDKVCNLAEQGSYILYLYYSVVIFTTLGFGDITPITELAMFIVVFEVIVGFVILGLLISILANKVSSRS